MTRLRRFLPRSLWAQMVLLTLGVILLVQAASFATVSWSWQQFTRDVAVELTATTLRTIRSSLEQVPSQERADFVRHASGGEWRLWSRTLPAHTRLERHRQRHERGLGRNRDTATPPARVSRGLRSFVDALNERLDDRTRVALSHSHPPRLYVSLTGEADSTTDAREREWLIIPLEHITPAIRTPLVLIWLAGMGLFLLLAAAFSWHITRPLSRLARAADQLAQGQPQRVTPSGPTETRILGERFNAMLDTLAESNAVQRTLLAGLPHDLKGPLSRMWLRIEMLEDAAFQEGMRQDIKDMQRMIDQFIGFVRGSDPASYHFEDMDLQPWLEDRIGQWQSAGIQVQLHADSPPTMPVRADRLALGRLVDNLITNALHHGKEPIDVRLHESGGQAIVLIADDGPGISEERRLEALRPFSRLDDARTRSGSVGLGLAVAEAIAKAHKGRLELLAPGTGKRGLHVRVALPLAVTDQPQPVKVGGSGGRDRPNMPR